MTKASDYIKVKVGKRRRKRGGEKKNERVREGVRRKAREAEGETFCPLEVFSSYKTLLMVWLYRSDLV